MPSTQIREIAAAQRLDNVRYAIRDLASVADEVTKQGHKVLSLNVGDPNIFDFQTPPHLIEAVSSGIGVGHVPSFLVQDELRAGTVALAIDRPLTTGLSYYLFVRQPDPLLPQVAVFKDWILSMATDDV